MVSEAIPLGAISTPFIKYGAVNGFTLKEKLIVKL